MTETRKRRSFPGFASETRDTLRDLLFTQPMAWLAQARVKLSDLPKTNFDLGCSFAEQGKWFDAMFRFRIVLYLQPNYPKAWYNLGCCYFRLGKLPQASAALKRALQQPAAHNEALFMLAAIDPAALPAGQRPQHMPAEMVTQFFTSITADYDMIEAQNQYQGGQVAFGHVKPLVAADHLALVDLGCGTGLAARPWRAISDNITGVDLTPSMAAMAANVYIDGRKLYDTLIVGDISALPPAVANAQADLVLAINVVQFVGDLGGVVAGAARALKPGGVFALSVEPFGGGGFGLNGDTGRFGHTAAYVAQQAAAAGFVPLRDAIGLSLYPGSDATLLIFRKGA